ncbi:hypothetical protein EYF80_035525 [Liparis tanakae]|uniref:Uncharacterized protein n=1 Tax=Liparis tanakae TaxID=230148 RepID=A0A4Z2GL92_9TELE|nr:hypothetical protein EYF80_035525 [Liparis tanakae]
MLVLFRRFLEQVPAHVCCLVESGMRGVNALRSAYQRIDAFRQKTFDPPLLSYSTKFLKKQRKSRDALRGLTSPASSARTKALLSLVQERTVSVRPSLNRRSRDRLLTPLLKYFVLAFAQGTLGNVSEDESNLPSRTRGAASNR